MKIVYMVYPKKIRRQSARAVGGVAVLAQLAIVHRDPVERLLVAMQMTEARKRQVGGADQRAVPGRRLEGLPAGGGGGLAVAVEADGHFRMVELHGADVDRSPISSSFLPLLSTTYVVWPG